MSAISLKSITGITSITTPSGVDNQLTLHTNNTTERVKIDVAGNVHINNHLAVAGVVTASSFVGALPITGDTNNRVITATGSGGLNGEANLTFDGSKLTLAANSTAYDAFQVGDGLFIGNTTNNISAAIFHQGGGADLEIGAQDAIIFTTGSTAGNATARLRIHPDGGITIGDIAATTSKAGILHTRASTTTRPVVFENDTENCDVVIKTTGTNKHSILGFGDGASNFAGNIDYDHQNNSMVFDTNGGERLNISSSGVVTQVETGTGNGHGGIKASTASGGGNAGFGFITAGTQRFNVTTIGSAGSEALRVYDNNNSVERLRIDANGDLNLGNNPTNQYGFKLNIQDSAIIYAQTASSGGLEAKWHLDNSAQLMELGTVTTDDLSLVTTNIERLRITSGGQVQIKENAGASSDGASLKFYFGNNNATDVISSIYFANNSGQVASIKGQTRNGNNYGMISFHNQVNGVDGESMRLNHDGGFCVGTDSTRTAEFTTPDGFSVRSRDSAKGQFQVSVTNESCALLNKKGNNGQIIGFRKDGTGVGEIGVNATTMYLNFGGTTAAAHQLDDYETGTWTCTVYYATGSTTGSHTNTTTITGYFEKIGNLVFIGLNFYPTNYNSGNTAIITKFSLPYNPVQRTALAFYRYSGAGNYGQMLPQSSQDDAGCYLDTAGHGVVLVGGTNQGSGYWGHHTGQVNAHGHVSGCYRIS